MKKRILLSIFLIIFMLFRQKISADPLTRPVPVPRDNTALENKPAMIPVVLVLLAEMTAADLALLSVGTAATALTITYYVTTPPPSIYSNFPVSPDEVVDVPTGGGGSDGGGRKPWLPQMQPEDQFILLINLANAGYQGYLKLTEGGQNPTSIADKLTALYFVDQKFAESVNQMQRDYDDGKMVAVPVYKPGTMIFDHFNYIFKIDEVPVRTTVKPGDVEWNSGVEYIRLCFERLNSGTATAKQCNLLGKFVDGNCMGDPECILLQNQIDQWSSNYPKRDFISVITESSNVLSGLLKISNELTQEDKAFIGEVFLNPNLLNDTYAFLRFMRIFNQLEDTDPVKSKLLEILCTKFPALPICQGFSPGGMVTKKMDFSDIVSMEGYNLQAYIATVTPAIEQWEQSKKSKNEVETESVPDVVLENQNSEEEPLAIEDIITILEDPNRTVTDPSIIQKMEDLKREYEEADEKFQKNESTEDEFFKILWDIEGQAIEILKEVTGIKEVVEETKKKRTGNYRGRTPGSKNKSKAPAVVEGQVSVSIPTSEDQQLSEISINTATESVSQALGLIERVQTDRADMLDDAYLSEQITEEEYDSATQALQTEVSYLENALLEYEYNDSTGIDQKYLENLFSRLKNFLQIEDISFSNAGAEVVIKNTDRNPDDNAKELKDMIGKIRDIQAEVVSLDDSYRAKSISTKDYKDRLYEIQTRFNKLTRKFRLYVKTNYNLPESVWRKGEKGKFQAVWVDKILKHLNGDTSKPVFKLGLQIYQACERTFRPIIEEARVIKRVRSRK